MPKENNRSKTNPKSNRVLDLQQQLGRKITQRRRLRQMLDHQGEDKGLRSHLSRAWWKQVSFELFKRPKERFPKGTSIESFLKPLHALARRRLKQQEAMTEPQKHTSKILMGAYPQWNNLQEKPRNIKKKKSSRWLMQFMLTQYGSLSV